MYKKLFFNLIWQSKILKNEYNNTTIVRQDTVIGKS